MGRRVKEAYCVTGTANGADSAAEALLRLLEGRRSAAPGQLGEPGPDPAQLRRLLAIASRAPDHGGLEPWRFILIEGDARARASARLADCHALENAAMAPEKRAKFTAVMGRIFLAAPTVVAVVSHGDPAATIPIFEQELSAGAVCMNLLTAAHAMGFDAGWVTGFAASNPLAMAALGAEAGEKIAGLIHIGTARERPAERKRPDLDAIATRWRDTGA